MITPARTPGDTDWFMHDRFGLFIHFGLYSLAARHEWVKYNEAIPDSVYQSYFAEFNPDLYDPRSWAAAARQAGMKYVVLTTKHHEGFCLWDSKLTDYKITNTPLWQRCLAPLCGCLPRRRAEGRLLSLVDRLASPAIPH